MAWGIGSSSAPRSSFDSRRKGFASAGDRRRLRQVGILLGKYLNYAFAVQEQAEAVGFSIGLFSGDMFRIFQRTSATSSASSTCSGSASPFTAWRVQPEPAPVAAPTSNYIRQVARPFLTRYCWWYSSAGQKVVAGTISVESARELRLGSRFDSAATSACSGEWVKIAERYCVPTSQPCRFTCVGSCRLQNRSTRSAYEISLGST